MTSSAPGSLTGEQIGPWERVCGALRVAVGNNKSYTRDKGGWE